VETHVIDGVMTSSPGPMAGLKKGRKVDLVDGSLHKDKFTSPPAVSAPRVRGGASKPRRIKAK